MRTILAALLLAAAVNAGAASPKEIQRKVDAFVAPYMQFNTFSGVILLAHGDEVIMNRGYGKANAEFAVPNAPDTRFPIASITKRFTMVILRRLIAEKKLAFSDPLSKWVPDFPSAEKITVEHLAGHKSGIRDPEKLRRKIRFNYTTAETVDQIKTEPLGSIPGETYSYTTANYAVLAHIIERVTGDTFANVIRKYIYEPAGMSDSGELTTTTVVPRLATGYMPDPFGNTLSVCGPEDTSWKAAGGSSYSTTRDLLRFHRALFAGKLLPKAEVSEAFQSSKLLERNAFRSSGAFPGANANATYFPDEEVTVVVMSNNYSPIAGNIAEAVARIYFGEKYEIPSATVLKDAPPPDPRMAGNWQAEGTPWPFKINFVDGKPVAVWNEIRRAALLPSGENSWFMPFDWATLTFEKDFSGGTMAAAWLEKPAKLMRK